MNRRFLIDVRYAILTMKPRLHQLVIINATFSIIVLFKVFCANFLNLLLWPSLFLGPYIGPHISMLMLTHMWAFSYFTCNFGEPSWIICNYILHTNACLLSIIILYVILPSHTERSYCSDLFCDGFPLYLKHMVMRIFVGL